MLANATLVLEFTISKMSSKEKHEKRASHEKRVHSQKRFCKALQARCSASHCPQTSLLTPTKLTASPSAASCRLTTDHEETKSAATFQACAFAEHSGATFLSHLTLALAPSVHSPVHCPFALGDGGHYLFSLVFTEFLDYKPNITLSKRLLINVSTFIL